MVLTTLISPRGGCGITCRFHAKRAQRRIRLQLLGCVSALNWHTRPGLLVPVLQLGHQDAAAGHRVRCTRGQQALSARGKYLIIRSPIQLAIQ
jgi:hypothetical protein